MQISLCRCFIIDISTKNIINRANLQILNFTLLFFQFDESLQTFFFLKQKLQVQIQKYFQQLVNTNVSMNGKSNYQNLNYSILQQKHTYSIDSITICNCPCRKQINQNERMLELHRQYIKTLQFQNLRRNQQRISLQTQITHLKLDLEQPTKQKEELNDKIKHLKKQIEILEDKLKRLDLQNQSKQQQISLLQDQLIKTKNQNIMLIEQKNIDFDQVQCLKNRLSEMYKKIQSSMPKQRRHTQIFNNKGQQNINEILDKINRKWQFFGQQLSKKYKVQKDKLQEKSNTQINILQKKLTELGNQLKQKENAIQNFLKEKKQFEQKVIISQKEIHSFKLIKEQQLSMSEKNQTKFLNIIKNLQKQIFQKQFEKKELNVLSNRQKADIQNLKFHNLKLQQQIQNLQAFSLKSSLRKVQQTQTQETQFSCFTQKKQFHQLKQKLTKYQAQFQEHKNQIFKLEQKIVSYSKIKQVFQQKQKQIQIHRDQEVKLKNLQRKKSNEKVEQFDKASLICISQIKTQLMIKQQELRQKDYQINCLQQINSKLKKLRINSLQQSSKLSSLQKQNFQLRKRLGLSKNQKIFDLKGDARSNVGNYELYRSNASNYTRKQNQQSNNKSLIKVNRGNRNEKSFFTSKYSDHIKSQKSNKSQEQQALFLDLLTLIPQPVVKSNTKSQQHFKLNNLKRQSLTDESKESGKKVNFYLKVPQNLDSLQTKSESQWNITVEQKELND